MEQKALELRREYLRKWRAANKDKVKKYNATYWEKKAQERKNEPDLGKGEPDGETVTA
ncbi:MAG: hypothetical protein J6N55_11615 [Anaerovibrio sp.]|uniref:hypothetical protein n=1 Tax=Anaerovibrio sp. TaxID=1872532 RepID=UPI001B26F1D4|nr:hypothetical protein [Anaerovibrio sp.]MBO6246907.1 hypothetical protein [Anaerovibrio sp.]